VRRRQAVRALIVSEPDESVLLLRMQRLAGDLWLMPGGGIKPKDLKRASNEVFAPRSLPNLVAGIFAKGPPLQPISLLD